MKNKIEIGELKSKVAYSFQQPYTRNFGFEKSANKKYTKENFRYDARWIATATPYLLENELLDVICTAVNKKKLRQFVDAFWRARPPNHNFFMEWDAAYASELLNINELEQEVIEMNYQQRVQADGKPFEGMIMPDMMGVSSSYRRHPVQEMYSYYTKSISKQVSPSRQEFMFHWANRKDNYVYTSPATLSIFMEEDMKSYAEMLQKHAKNLPEAAIKKTMNGQLPDTNGSVILKKWLELEHIPKDIEEIGAYIGIGPHCTMRELDKDHIRDQNKYHSTWRAGESATMQLYLQPNKMFFGYEKHAFLIMLSAISMLNYDWVVNKEAGVIARGSKSVNTEVLPQDLYKRVTINLPKDKAVKEFMKPMPRTRKFGTAEHSVRGHWRVYKKTGIRVWIAEHHRGDSKYGTVTKDYVLAKKPGFLKQANTLEPSSTIH